MLELIARTSLILAAACIGARLLAHATAATRHLLWQTALVAVLAAPALVWVIPRFEIGWLPVDSRQLPVDSQQSTVDGRQQSPPVDSRQLTVHSSQQSISRQSPVGRQVAASAGTIWMFGSALWSLWFLATHLMASSLLRRARPASDRLQHESDILRGDLGIRRLVPVRVLECAGSPLTTGIFAPHIIVPAVAEGWDNGQRRAVLLHELAHVRRHDCGVQAVAQAACALYWFNPLVWFAARALRSERERACDDEVLARGAQASAYAAQLLEIARGMHVRLASPAVVAMARPNELEGRLLAILAAHRARVPAKATRWIVASAVAAATIATLGAQGSSSTDSSATPGGAEAPPLRSAAIHGLGGADGQPPREAALHDAVRSGGASAPPSAPSPPQPLSRNTRALSAALADPSRDVREKAAFSLALDSSPDVIPALIAALDDPAADVREKAALGLASRRDARVVEPLIVALGDVDPQVREKAAIALGTTGDTRAVAPLEAALKDPDAQVREKAVVGLTLLRSPDSIDNGETVRRSVRAIVNGLLKLTQ